MSDNNDLGLKKGKVILVPYNDNWPKRYEDEYKRLQNLFDKKTKCKFEHIGSTSIIGIRSKPILDILIGFYDRASESDIIEVLEKDGAAYIENSAGSDMTLFVKGDPSVFHYHVTKMDSHHWYGVRRIRDHLNLYKKLAHEYEVIKADLAEKYPFDRAAYGSGKKYFLDAIDTRAKNLVKLNTYQSVFLQNRLITGRASLDNMLWTRRKLLKIT